MAANRALVKTGQAILDVSQQLVPVDTGALKASGSVRVAGVSTIYVEYTEPYAMHVEYGTVHSPAQPYIRPAFHQAGDTYITNLADEMRKLV